MNKQLVEEFGFMVSADLLNLLLGTRLGSGSFREVFALRGDEADKVVKVETAANSFFNILEWEMWNDAPPKWRKWLAPCLDISPCGTCLVQARVKPATKRPARIPSFLDDNKLSNWGTYKGRIVCCDYGHHRFFKDGFRTAKLRCGRDLWITPQKDL